TEAIPDWALAMDKSLMKTIEQQDAATRTTRAGFTTASFPLLGKPAMSVTSSAFFGSQMGFYWLPLAFTENA
ncbi:MAG: hypothetical protein WBZ27_19805, partial [Pseudolabrys sp.]